MGPYKVTKALPSKLNYKLELPPELIKRQIHKRFHVGLLRPTHTTPVATGPLSACCLSRLQLYHCYQAYIPVCIFFH